MMMATNLIAQNLNTAAYFKLSENKIHSDSMYIKQVSQKNKYGEKKFHYLATNVTILDAYTAAYGLPAEKFIFQQNLDKERLTTQKYNIEFEGDEKPLNEKLDSSFALITKKIYKDSLYIVISKIDNSPAFRTVKNAPVKRTFSVINSGREKQVKGIMTVKDIVDFISKQFACKVIIENNLSEEKMYDVNFTYEENFTADDLIAQFNKAGIFLKNKNKKNEFVLIEESVTR
jgi:hypothetical protein